MEKKPSKARRKPARIDWLEARRLYEVERLSKREIGRRLGCKAHTVCDHARRDRWAHVELGTVAAQRAVEKLSDRMAAEIGDRLVRGAAEDLDLAEEQRRQHREALWINGRILAGLRRAVAPAEGIDAPALVFGEGASPDLTLRRSFLNLQTRLKDDAGNGAASAGGSADCEADAAAVRAALDEAEGDEPGRRRAGAARALPD